MLEIRESCSLLSQLTLKQKCFQILAQGKKEVGMEVWISNHQRSAIANKGIINLPFWKKIDVKLLVAIFSYKVQSVLVVKAAPFLGINLCFVFKEKYTSDNKKRILYGPPMDLLQIMGSFASSLLQYSWWPGLA